MKTFQAPTVTVTLHLAGCIEAAKQIIRRVAFPGGMCVTISPELFIYAGGEEQGYRIGFVNYPRFPTSAQEIINQATRLLETLINETHQHSGLLEGPDETVWMTRRPV